MTPVQVKELVTNCKEASNLLRADMRKKAGIFLREDVNFYCSCAYDLGRCAGIAQQVIARLNKRAKAAAMNAPAKSRP